MPAPTGMRSSPRDLQASVWGQSAKDHREEPAGWESGRDSVGVERHWVTRAVTSAPAPPGSHAESNAPEASQRCGAWGPRPGLSLQQLGARTSGPPDSKRGDRPWERCITSMLSTRTRALFPPRNQACSDDTIKRLWTCFSPRQLCDFSRCDKPSYPATNKKSL